MENDKKSGTVLEAFQGAALFEKHNCTVGTSSHPNDRYGKLNGEQVNVLKKELMEELNIN